MTYQEALENNPNLITAEIDDALKATIADWFNYRHVADDDLFGVYFNRVLNRDYGRYKQLLRIQAGSAEYDWLVGNYMERQTTNTGENTQTATNTGKQTATGATSGKQTNSGSDTIADTGTVTNSGRDHSVTTNSGTETGTGKTTNSGTDTTTTSGTDNNTRNLTDTTTFAGSETNTRTGSETDAATHNKGATSTTQSTKNNQSHTSTNSGNPQTLTNHYVGNSAAAKSAPMDSGVASQGSVTLPGSMGTIPGVTVNFDSHATNIQQSQTDDKQLVQETLDSTTTDSYSGDADTVQTEGAAVEDTDSATKTYNSVKDEKAFSTDRKDTQTHTGTDNRETSGTQSTVHGLVTDTTDSKTTEETGNAETTRENTQTNDTLQTSTFGRIIDTTGTSENTTETSGTQETTGTNSSVYRERFAGRTEPPADILIRAVSFIESTNAWEWLMPRIDVCFQSIYDI